MARAPLNRERVVRAAVDLADSNGWAAVSMRRVAGELDVVPMALYKHVADKEALVDAMVDAVIEEYDEPSADAGWKEAVRARVLSARRALQRHPWARLAIESRTTRSETVLGYMDALAGDFRSGGFSPALIHHVMHVLGNRIWGFSPELFNPSAADEPAPPPDPAALAVLAERFPNIAAIATAATGGDRERVGAGCDEDFEFAFALDLLLDAFGRLHEAGWSAGRDVGG